MGAWGTAAWDNDRAADWYGDLFDATGLAKHVEEALSRDPQKYPEEIRAAAYVLVALGQGYLWPSRDLGRHLALAVEKLEAVRTKFQADPEFVSAIDEELAVLRPRLQFWARQRET